MSHSIESSATSSASIELNDEEYLEASSSSEESFDRGVDHRLSDSFTTFFNIKSGTDLKAADRDGFSDPYVRCFKKGDKKHAFKSKVVEHSLNPVWNAKWSVVTYSNDLSTGKDFVFEVWDKDSYGKDFLGIAYVDIETLKTMDSPGSIDLQLQPRNKKDKDVQGFITLDISFGPVIVKKNSGTALEKKILIPLLEGDIESVATTLHPEVAAVFTIERLGLIRNAIVNKLGALTGVASIPRYDLKQYLNGKSMRSQTRKFNFDNGHVNLECRWAGKTVIQLKITSDNLVASDFGF
eukprot:TRINITY_DN10268_c0_g1_i1.p1 TRINITY_DN10268_c0_g1~~TRINITY_DN10268_c0_g1_i1.p1  ORF type:complete len:295 (-),score=55.75 TRINITY_DN10268_c0_g1_i1:24-908(-)